MRKYFIGILLVCAGGMLVGASVGGAVAHRDTINCVATAIHNAAATGDEMIIDGLRYRFVVVGKEE